MRSCCVVRTGEVADDGLLETLTPTTDSALDARQTHVLQDGAVRMEGERYSFCCLVFDAGGGERRRAGNSRSDLLRQVNLRFRHRLAFTLVSGLTANWMQSEQGLGKGKKLLSVREGAGCRGVVP